MRTFLTIIRYVVLVSIALAMALPLFWMISTSLRTPEEVWTFPPKFFPDTFRWKNYIKVFRQFPLFLYLRNTLLIAIPVVIGCVLSSSFCAYGFTFLEFPGRKIWFLILLSTAMLPAITMLIPEFIVFRWLGWVGDYRPLIVPAFLGGGPFNIFLYCMYYRTLPRNLVLAARMDRASEPRIYWEIILPNSKPIIITTVLLTFIGVWNDFISPLIYLRNEKQWTLALGIAEMKGAYSTDWPSLMAASTLMILPVIVLFLVFNRYLVVPRLGAGSGYREENIYAHRHDKTEPLLTKYGRSSW